MQWRVVGKSVNPPSLHLHPLPQNVDILFVCRQTVIEETWQIRASAAVKIVPFIKRSFFIRKWRLSIGNLCTLIGPPVVFFVELSLCFSIHLNTESTMHCKLTSTEVQFYLQCCISRLPGNRLMNNYQTSSPFFELQYSKHDVSNLKYFDCFCGNWILSFEHSKKLNNAGIRFWFLECSMGSCHGCFGIWTKKDQHYVKMYNFGTCQIWSFCIIMNIWNLLKI